MDSSESDESQETRINPSEPEHERIDPVEPPIDLADEHTPEDVDDLPASERTGAPYDEPHPFVHTPESVYMYDGTEETQHMVLGRLKPGENRFETEEPVMVAALEACCAEGLLRQVTPGSEPDSDELDEQEGASDAQA